MLSAEPANLIVDLVPNPPRLLHFFLMRASKFRGIRERPVQPRRYARENWTTCGFGFVANGDDVGEELSGFENVEYRLGFVF